MGKEANFLHLSHKGQQVEDNINGSTQEYLEEILSAYIDIEETEEIYLVKDGTKVIL